MKERESQRGEISSDRWREVLESTYYRTNPSRLWREVRSLHTRQVGPVPTHEAILRPKSRTIPTPRGQADLLVDHYAAISRLPHSRTDRLTQRRLRQLPLDQELPCDFTPAMVSDAIRRTGSSTARGVDGVAYAHLKHGVRAFAVMFNLSFRLNTILVLWKVSFVVPLLKLGKPLTQAVSYRPISLLYPLLLRFWRG